jgi:hypothetical protein
LVAVFVSDAGSVAIFPILSVPLARRPAGSERLPHVVQETFAVL